MKRKEDRQRCHCSDCERDLDDLTGTIFAFSQVITNLFACGYCASTLWGSICLARRLARSLVWMQTARMTWQLNFEMEFLRRSPRSYFRVKRNVECDQAYIVARHKGNPEGVEKRTGGASEALKRRSRSWHIGEREAFHLRDDSAVRRSGDSNARKRPTSSDRAIDARHDCYWYNRLHRRIRHLLSCDSMGLRAPHCEPRQKGIRS